MSQQPEHKLNAQFMVAHARAAKAYYSLFSLTPAEDGKWELRFFVAGRPDDVEAVSPISTPALHRLLNRHFSGDGKDRPIFESENGTNMHVARIASKQRGEELAHELMELFESTGISPMADQLQLYKPPGAPKAMPMSIRPLHESMTAARENAVRPLIRRNNWHFNP